MSKSASQIMSDRKEIVRQAQEAFDRGDYAKKKELDTKAKRMLQEAMDMGGLDAESSYGLMGS